MDRYQVEFEDCAQASESAAGAGWDLDYVQLESGSYLGRFRAAEAKGVLLNQEISNLGMSVSGTPPPGYVLVSLFGSGNPPITTVGGVLQAHEMLICPSGSWMQLSAASATIVNQLVLPVQLFEQDSMAELIEVTQGREVLRKRPNRFSQGLYSIVNHGFSLSMASDEEIIDGILASLSETMAAGRAIDKSKKWETIVTTKAVGFVQDRYRDSISVMEMCNEIGVSIRTLERYFKRAYGISPWQYIRRVRLSRTREALLRSRSDEVRVSDISRYHGIEHQGRFAAEYRTMFGEYPAQTVGSLNQ